ncbi:MAG: PilZ domain-containing protein [Syntrophales bacterium]
MAKERRRRTRVPVQIDVDILLKGGVIKLKAINISLLGLLCSSNPLLRMDGPCTVIIALGGDIQISIDARIVRVGGKETAIKFISMDDESFVHLKKLIQYNLGNAERVDAELRRPAFS